MSKFRIVQNDHRPLGKGPRLRVLPVQRLFKNNEVFFIEEVPSSSRGISVMLAGGFKPVNAWTAMEKEVSAPCHPRPSAYPPLARRT